MQLRHHMRQKGRMSQQLHPARTPPALSHRVRRQAEVTTVVVAKPVPEGCVVKVPVDLTMDCPMMPAKPRRDLPNWDRRLEHLINPAPFRQTQVRIMLSHGSLHC